MILTGIVAKSREVLWIQVSADSGAQAQKYLQAYCQYVENAFGIVGK